VNGAVLIADADRGRGKAIVDACAARGIDCETTGQGAEALELALTAGPAAIVVQLDLPLIDGPMLSSILRANPRTRDIGLLFVGARPVDADRTDLDGDVMLPPIDPDRVARRVQVLLMQRSSPKPEAQERVDLRGVEGKLSQLPLVDLLELFHGGRKTGSVELTHGEERGDEPETAGHVVLSAGEVIHAEAGEVQGEKALYRLLAWDRGSFAFKPEPVAVTPTIHSPTRTLLREGRRQLKEWEQLAFELPPADSHVALTVKRGSLPNAIHPLTHEVLVALEHHSRVRDILDHCASPDDQVLRTLHTLIERGMLERRSAHGSFEQTPTSELFTPAQVSRLREWLGASRPRGRPAADAKLLVVPADARARTEFALLLEEISDVDIDARLTAGAISVDDLARFGRIAIDAENGIEIVHVPAAGRFAPIWPLVGRGALGTVFVLAAPVDQAAAAVLHVEQALRKLPRARVFHLVLLEKGDRDAPDTLRRHLDLLEEGSLFLVPLENRDKARILIRDLFARIVP
jgi:CheY-like chemotaxis protein